MKHGGGEATALMGASGVPNPVRRVAMAGRHSNNPA
jgi:hypothetical protein